MPKIKEIRYLGLHMAVEFESFEVMKGVMMEGLARGIITDWFLYNDKSLRLAPPLIITEDEIQKACNIILESVNAL